MKTLLLTALAVILPAFCGHGENNGLAAADLLGIPTVPYKTSGLQVFPLRNVKSIVVDARYADTRDEQGSTLIPPALFDFATTFVGDLQDTLGIHLSVSNGSAEERGSIFLTLGNPKDYLDAAGEETSEGYTLTTNANGITITGASPLGVWWGTRTVLQQGVLKNGAVPFGSGVDVPGWKTRGMMLDCGRHFYPKDFIMEICSYMSYFKQNTFHLHLSDNLYTNPNYTYEQTMELYARFRLWSDSPALAGLAKYQNESYTRADFDEIQSICTARGVTLPEIEAPGHALPIVQWKPEIGYQGPGDLSLLNISHPETIPTMQTIWAEFLPWFHTKTVSIGADEYTGPATDYNTFVNTMDGFIGETSGKSIRIWGTFPPVYNSTYVNIYQNVSIQHWEYFEDDPYYQYILNNYSVVNSNDDFYIVNKWGGYPNTINLTKTFEGNPADHGLWYPYMFNQNNASDNPQRNNPYVLGGIEALWNDYGYNTSVFLEAYYAWRPGLPALADKLWGGTLTRPQFDQVFPLLHPYVPAQNLDRAIPSKGDTVFSYTFGAPKLPWWPFSATSSSSGANRGGQVKDSSPNGYDATTDCAVTRDATLSMTPGCALTTPWASKGRNYTLSLTLLVDALADPTNTTLAAGSDSVLMLTPNITLFASGNYYRLNSTVPLGEWVELTVQGRGNQTFASVSSAAGAGPGADVLVPESQFLTQMGINGQYFHWDVMGIEAPIQQVMGWTGQLREMTLTSTA